MWSGVTLSNKILKISVYGEPTISSVIHPSVALISGEDIFCHVKSELHKLQLQPLPQLISSTPTKKGHVPTSL